MIQLRPFRQLSAILATLALLAAGCHAPIKQQHNLPAPQQLAHPGPGVAGPGPGVMAPAMPPMLLPAPTPTVQVNFNNPQGMQVQWDVRGVGSFDSEPLISPGRQTFPQGGIYRLKLTNIPGPGREGVELYPTLEVGPATPRSESYLAHNTIPVDFTQEDFDQVLVGNYVTKVIYLPDPEFHALALGDVDTLVSTKLDLGVDPIVEAERRGAIMAVIRMGNKDMELEGALAAGAMGGGVAGHGGMVMPPHYVSGVTTPQWGMPITGTPIGLPGPPHVPLGGQAGLQKHVMKNHTFHQIPKPVEKFKIHVRQQPGLSYPKPPSRMSIKEQTIHPGLPYRQPRGVTHQTLP